MNLKRTFDLTFSIFLLILLSPIFLLIPFLILIFLGRPIFFCQSRPGKDQRPFVIYKFRTMKNKKGIDESLDQDKLRLTKFGSFLRSTSLDELPELINVVKGDMSLVGPRPLLMEYLDLYTEDQKKRHNVLPGITGWAQINGRNNITWDEKFELDLWYVSNMNFMLDFKILFLSLFKVIAQKDINHEGKATTEKFKGKI